MGVVFTFPDEADLSDDSLATKPHSTLHGDLGDTLEAYIAALGKVTDSGFVSKPTLFDPLATNWYDSWHYTIEDGLPSGYVFEDQVGVGVNSPNYNEHYIERFVTRGFVRHEAYTQSDSGNEFIVMDLLAQLDRNTGVKTLGGLSISSDDGEAIFGFNGTAIQAYLKAVAGQSDPLLDLQDSDANSIAFFKPAGGIQLHGLDEAAIERGRLDLGLNDTTGDTAELQTLDATGQQRNDFSVYDTSMELNHVDATGDVRSRIVIGDANGEGEHSIQMRSIDTDGFTVKAAVIADNSGVYLASEGVIVLYTGNGLDVAARPAVPTQVAAVSVSDFNAIRTAMIALGIWTDGD